MVAIGVQLMILYGQLTGDLYFYSLNSETKAPKT